MKTIHQICLTALAIGLAFGSEPLSAQSGSSYFADFELAGRANQGVIFSMAQDAEGNLEIATSNGVVVYDGSNTSLVGTGADVDELDYVPEMGKTYVGCEGRIGFISKNNFGKYTFTKIPLTGMDLASFADICHIGKDVYFQSDEWVVKVENDKVVQKWKRPAEGNFAGIFTLQNTVFVNISSSGLWVLNSNGTMKKHSVADSRLAETYIAFAIQRANNEVILGTEESQLLLFNGSQITDLVLDKTNYLADNLLTGGKRIDNNYMALTTYRGGLLVANMYNGIVSEVYNTSTGFPDDQITCITVDKSQGIWTSHEVGITRIDRNIPVKFFSAYPGLHARVTSVAEYNGTLYLGCSDGLYWLKSADNAQEYENAVKITDQVKKEIQQENRKQNAAKGNKDDGDNDEPAGPITVKTDPNPTDPGTTGTGETKDPGTTTDQGDINNAGKKIKKLWQRAKDKVKGGGGSGGTKSVGSGDNGEKSLSIVPRRTPFRYAALGTEKGLQFFYAKVAGLNARVKKILMTSHGLVLATNDGLYSYGAEGVKKLFDGDIKDASYGFGKVVFVSNYGVNILTDDMNLYPVQLSAKHRNIGTVYLEQANVMWLGEMNRAVKVNISATGEVQKETDVDVPAEFRDMITINKCGDVVFLVSASGLYEYQPGSNTAVKSTIIDADENDVLHYLINPSGNTLYVRSNEGWKEIKSKTETANMGLMDVITDIRYVFRSASSSLWTISHNGFVYFLNKNLPNAKSFAGFDVFIRGVNSFNGNAFDLSDLSISYRDAAVEFKWGSNLFLKSNGTWFQYKIEGAGRGQWSPWTRQTSLKIQLNPGSYTFVVHARDVFGNVSPDKTLSFRIQPPFWQTWWFYTIVGLLLALVVWQVFRWRNRALLEKQKVLEAMVKERTKELAEEKEKTEGLLLNILPKAVAQELKEVGQSSVRKHSDSAVMFTDFCDFTKLSKNMTAEELVMKLDSYFRKFDEIVDKYGLEKIKTIGDSYMCAAGVPQPKNHSSLSIVMAALEIIEVVEKEDTNWKIRVGIHQGGLVSGVVGKRKFAYDIWGDTVNVASRMESSSEPMNINITEQVYDKIKDYFECEKRGEVEAKSLGKTSMYFVKGLKPAFRSNGSSLVPNKDFLALLN